MSIVVLDLVLLSPVFMLLSFCCFDLDSGSYRDTVTDSQMGHILTSFILQVMSRHGWMFSSFDFDQIGLISVKLNKIKTAHKIKIFIEFLHSNNV